MAKQSDATVRRRYLRQLLDMYDMDMGDQASEAQRIHVWNSYAKLTTVALRKKVAQVKKSMSEDYDM